MTMIFYKIVDKSSNFYIPALVINNNFMVSTMIKQGPTNIFYKTCPWASGMQKSLAQKDEVVVPCHRWYKCCRNYFAPFSGNK